MKDSILTSIKKLLGLEDEYTCFDSDIIMHINSALAVLSQLGVGPAEGFSIYDKFTTWEDFLGSDLKLSLVKTYVYAKVRMVFDPPTSSVVAESLNRTINEFEWRINHVVEMAEN